MLYPWSVNGVAPTTARELARCGLRRPADVRYMIAWHSEQSPVGLVFWLLRSLDDIPPKFRKA